VVVLTGPADEVLLGGLAPAEQTSLLSAGVRAALDGFEPGAELTRLLDATLVQGPVERAIVHHAHFYLADQTLVAADRATMAASLEVRAPLLDPALIALAGRIPTKFKLHGWTTKYLLKRAATGLLPTAIIHRRKQGLGVPIAAWLRGPLRGILEERLVSTRVARRGLFDPATVTHLIREHVAGHRNHRKVLWALLMFDAWCDHYLPHERWT